MIAARANLFAQSLPGKDSLLAAIRLMRERTARLMSFKKSPPSDDSPITMPIPEERSEHADAAAALALMLALAREIPWNTVFKRMKSEMSARGLGARLTALQKALLPTLQLIHMQLQEGDEFTLEELQQLSEGLNVPVPVMRESLEDLARKMVRFGLVMLAEKTGTLRPETG